MGIALTPMAKPTNASSVAQQGGLVAELGCWVLRVTAIHGSADVQSNRWLPCRHVMYDKSLARRCPVEVHVGIETQGPPIKARLDIIRRAAARFTDDKASICAMHEPRPDRHCLIAQFTMRTTAQYKVVDKIAAGFKIDI
jgi:hypothetical protein